MPYVAELRGQHRVLGVLRPACRLETVRRAYGRFGRRGGLGACGGLAPIARFGRKRRTVVPLAVEKRAEHDPAAVDALDEPRHSLLVPLLDVAAVRARLRRPPVLDDDRVRRLARTARPAAGLLAEVDEPVRQLRVDDRHEPADVDPRP